MACLLCGAQQASHRIVDTDDGSIAAAVCHSCTEESLLVDPGSPTCEFCSELADYALARVSDADDPPRPGDDGDALETVEEAVICDEHLGDLRAEAPQPS